MTAAVHRAVEAVWRIEPPRIIAGSTRIVKDVGIAEELRPGHHGDRAGAVAGSGVPPSPGAWLMSTAKHRAIDAVRRRVATRRSSPSSADRL